VALPDATRATGALALAALAGTALTADALGTAAAGVATRAPSALLAVLVAAETGAAGLVEALTVARAGLDLADAAPRDGGVAGLTALATWLALAGASARLAVDLAGVLAADCVRADVWAPDSGAFRFVDAVLMGFTDDLLAKVVPTVR